MDPKAVKAASWITIIGKLCPVRACAFTWSWPKRASSPAISPAHTACFDIFSLPPGNSEVINQVDLLSSIEMKIAPRSVRIAVDASDRSATICMSVS